MVIAFMLMPHGTDDDLIGISNFEQCNVTGTAESNDEFANECAITEPV